MKLKEKLIAALLLICCIVSLSGCGLLGDALDGAIDDLIGDVIPGEVLFPEEDEEIPDEWVDNSTHEDDAEHVRIMLGESLDLNGYLAEPVASPVWESDCDGIASVESGVAVANKAGRTEISVKSNGVTVGRFVVTVEFAISGTGYNFTTSVVDEDVHPVNSIYEANRLLDRAISEHNHKITIDFSGVSPDFDIRDGFDLNSEFGNHTSLKMQYYPSKPYIVEFEIVYNKKAATYTAPLTEEYTYLNVPTLNVHARRTAAIGSSARADDYEGFAINSIAETFPVYNSEELWWAVEQGYRPIFPQSGTKAELFYERAKMILRDIITDGMTDYEKALAIYEYLIEAVAYDYDAYYSAKTGEEEKENTCYYLEGVFEKGRAVCDGKTKAFVLLAGMEGIDCVRAFGSSLTGSVGHAWNYVKIDGYWYLVDTTEGDARFESSSAISKFFGYRFESVSYDSFLKPLFSHYDKYEYTEMWADITVPEKNYAYGDSYFNAKLNGTGHDFYIESAAEAEALLSAYRSSGAADDFIVVFIPAVSDRSYSYFNRADSVLGRDYDMTIFTLSYEDMTVYLAMFKAAR